MSILIIENFSRLFNLNFCSELGLVVRRLPRRQEVVGSNPPRAQKFIFHILLY